MHSKSDDIEVIGYDNPDESVVELLDFFFSRYQIALKTQMSGNDFCFGCVNFLYYKCHKKSFKRGGSYIDSPILDKNTPQMMMLGVLNMQQQML